MDLPNTVNAPRICYFGTDVYFVRAMSLEGLAILLAWLDDVIPGRAERTMPPKFSDERCQEALASSVGGIMLTYVSLRDQGVDYARACELSSQLTDTMRLRLLEVLFAHRRTMESTPSGGDISETWCGKGMAQLVQAIGYRETLALSMDQFAWLMADGEIDTNPAHSQERLAEIQRKFVEEELPRIKAWQADQEVKRQGGQI